VAEIRVDLPRHLGRVIGRCLEKDRRDRFQTARDVFNELKALRRESAIGGRTRFPADVSAPAPARPVSNSSDVRRSDVPWIAVLPFGCPKGDPDIETFADGLEEDIATGLSRFSYLFVVSRKSTRRYRGEATDVRQVGEELGARYVMEGSIRSSGSRIRIGMNLIDTETGTHLWSETYDRNLDTADVFELQDEITDRVVATVADTHGALTRSMAIDTDSKSPETLTSHEAVLRLFLYRQRISAEDHLIARAALEHAAERDPNNAEVLAALASLCVEEANHDFNPRPDPLGRALAIARRAVEADPASQLAHFYLAQTHFHSQNLSGFRAAANRALELNRRSTDIMAMLGILFGYSGDWEKGVELARRAMELNPLHPGWYRFSPFMNAYRQRRDAEALEIAQQINMPEYWGDPLTRTVAHAQLGNRRAAEGAARDLVRLWPDFENDYKRVGLDPWVYAEPELEDRLVDGLEKAGLKIRGVTRDAAGAKPASSTRRTSRRTTLGIAVLPFTDMSPDKDQDYFCEGMAEEIMNALVHVDGIRVASRTSAFKAVEKGGDLQAIGRALSVGQILEGSVRLSGNRLRVTAQLTEVESGYQLWSKRYDREAEDVFAVQDEIAAGVVEAVKSRLAPGERTIRARSQVSNVEAYRHYLKARHYRYSKNDHGNALKCYEQAVALDPSHGPSWVGIAESKMLGAMYNLVSPRQAAEEARSALAIAEAGQGENAEALYVQGQIAYAERNWAEAERVLRRALELEPDHVRALCWLAVVLTTLRQVDEAMSALERARESDPLAAYPYGMTAASLLMIGDPGAALEYARQAAAFEEANTLTLWSTGIASIAIGRFEEGLETLAEAVEHGRRGGFLLGLLGWALAASGRVDEARAILDELQRRPAGAPTVVPEAWLLAVIGRHEDAWGVLERAIEENQLVVSFTEYPGYDSLRSDPRFPAFVERLGLPPSPAVTQ
jgi:TolB-like protein/Flp pilus assembly protein TadD